MLTTETHPVRDRRTLLEQIRTIESFLSDGRTDDDALATCSRGWRPVWWDPEKVTCTAADCGAAHDHGVHPRETPRYQSEVDGALARWPRYVVLGVPRALNTLPQLDQDVVRGMLCLGIGRSALGARLTSWVKVAEYAGCSDKTAKAHYDAALVEIARQVWDENGQPIW